MPPSRMMKLATLLGLLSCLTFAGPSATAQDLGTDPDFFSEDSGAEAPEEDGLFYEEDLPENMDPMIDGDAAVPPASNEPMPSLGPTDPQEDFATPNGREPGQPYKIRHPNAKKGLVRITKDKTYIYKVKTSEQEKAASLRFGMFDPANLQNPETGTRFNDLYDDTEAPILLFDYEWQIWRGALGKMGVKAGTGVYAASGHGTFKGSANAGETPRETFTFVVLPNTVGGIWRMQFTDNQILVPYAEGGLGYYTFAEIRDDDQGPKFGGALTAYGAGGVAFNMGFLNTRSMLTLDRDYGINSVFLTAEFRLVQGLHSDFDFSSNVLNAGFMVEF